jgi:tellurite resistance protein TerC
MVILICIFTLVFGIGLLRDFNSCEGCEKAIERSIFWTVAAFVYGLLIVFLYSPDKACEYWICLTVEKMLSLDNLFVFSIIFSSLKLSQIQIKKALTYGIVGAIIFRCIFLFLGVSLIKSFAWILPIFGVILIWTGITLLINNKDEEDGFKSFKFLEKLPKFMLAIALIEINDLIFAIDSVPAVLNISQDMFIVATSNIAAIQCLRSYYQVYEKFKLSATTARFDFEPVEKALAAVLILIGCKNIFPVHVPIALWLAVVAGIVCIGVLQGRIKGCLDVEE